MSVSLPSSDAQPIRIKTIAEWLGISDKTVRRRIDSLEIKSIKMGGLRVVLRRDFNTYLQNLSQKGVTNV